MPADLLIRNCRLLHSPEGRGISIAIKKGIISRITSSKIPFKSGQILEIGGRLVAPGFIDLHIQGAGGCDVLDGSEEALRRISRTCPRFGTTSFLATTVFRPDGDNGHLKVAAESVAKDLGGANLLGIHLEGPFISTEKRGMILPSCICRPSKEILEKSLRMTKGTLRIMTMAPELEGSMELLPRLLESGVVPSFGHSNATYEQTNRGIEGGISHVTHLFNAMPSLHHRNPGPLLAILEAEQMMVQMITDGVHLHPRMINLAFDLFGKNRVITITDGMNSMGLPDGRYLYNEVEYESRDGAARYDDGTLIGTTLGMGQMLQRLTAFTGCSLSDAIETATVNPARALGLEDRKGNLAVGRDADLVVLDADQSVWATIVGGETVFKS